MALGSELHVSLGIEACDIIFATLHLNLLN